MRLRFAVPMLLLFLLCACGTGDDSAQTAVSFRTKLKEAEACRYQASVTGDYGAYVREFVLDCCCTQSSSSFVVVEPDSVAGITAEVSGEQAQVSYDDTILAVENFESRRISPMAAPWLLSQAWCQGYISSVSTDGALECTEYRLGYGMEELIVTTDFENGVPVRGEISDGTRVLITCLITDFTLK